MADDLLLTRFCVGCHSNRGIAQAIARVREKTALRQSEFASYVSRQQAAIPFIRVASRLISAAGFLNLSRAQSPRLKQIAVYVRYELLKMNRLWGTFPCYISHGLCRQKLIWHLR